MAIIIIVFFTAAVIIPSILGQSLFKETTNSLNANRLKGIITALHGSSKLGVVIVRTYLSLSKFSKLKSKEVISVNDCENTSS